MKSEPKAVLRLRTQQLDPDSAAAHEMAEEVAERVLRDLAPQKESRYFPNLRINKPEPSEAT